MSLKLKIRSQKRKGFTLLEVLFSSLALAVVATILFGVTTSAHLTTLNITGKIVAQNIAQATLEDIRGQNNYQLDLLIAGMPALANYPTNDETIAGGYHTETSDPILLKSITSDTDNLLAALKEFNEKMRPEPDTNSSINLFKYTANPFSREITITALGTAPKSYSIVIKVTWRLNSTLPEQNLEILGTKN
jgi:prepilin-type N-terminal cleavage/methylation domain-containing protein